MLGTGHRIVDDPARHPRGAPPGESPRRGHLRLAIESLTEFAIERIGVGRRGSRRGGYRSGQPLEFAILSSADRTERFLLELAYPITKAPSILVAAHDRLLELCLRDAERVEFAPQRHRFFADGVTFALHRPQFAAHRVDPLGLTSELAFERCRLLG